MAPTGQRPLLKDILGARMMTIHRGLAYGISLNPHVGEENTLVLKSLSLKIGNYKFSSVEKVTYNMRLCLYIIPGPQTKCPCGRFNIYLVILK